MPQTSASPHFDLPAARNFQKLLRHFELDEGFALIFLLVPEARFAGLCRQELDGWLKEHGKGNLQSLSFPNPADLERLPEQLLAIQTDPDAAALWCEAAFPRLEVPGSLYSEWHRAWGRAAAKLNRVRDGVVSRLSIPLLLVGAPWLRETVRDSAPDFWSIRTFVTELWPPPPRERTSEYAATVLSAFRRYGAGDPTRYIQALRYETSHFDVQGLRFGDNKAYRFPIDEFYIPLTTSSRDGARTAMDGEVRSGTIQLEKAIGEHRKLLVVGDPGAGKSTFLKRVTFRLCNEYSAGNPLPVRIEAAVLSGYIAREHEQKLGPADPASPDWMPVFLGAQSDEKNRDLGADYFRARLKAGGCTVLIDGLDEAPDELHRERLVKLIHEAAAAFDGCRFVVTSRPEGKIPIAGFEEALIGDLEPVEIRKFLAKLAKLLYQDDENRERKFREELDAAVNARREIRKMTRNPVMLTALAVLQHNNVRLPERRVDLYGSILEWLSRQRAKQGRLPASECLLRLRELALEMQNHVKGRQKQVPLVWAGEKLATRFANREAAERFLRAEQADSGIVVSRGSDIVFWHLTFQEYLAALEIAGWEEADQYKLLLSGRNPRIYEPEWRETVLLFGGLLYKTGARKVDALLRRLLDKMGKQPSLAIRAKCVGLIGGLLPDLVGYAVSDKRYAESLRLVMDIFDAEKSKPVPFQDRLAAAEALGQAGDPRLAKHEWVTIPAARNYWIGAQDKDPKGRNYDEEAYGDELLRKVNLAPFRIGKYPVAVAQYLMFVEDGIAPDREPVKWEKQQEHPNWPVVNVTWHQARAYCEWAGGRLPTEEEWERAARGPSGTKYPWGNEDIDPSRANYYESNIGHPTPVGLYPCGASVEGVCDLVGNVLEWTSSEWAKGSGTYVWRGGCFDFDRRSASSSCRNGNQPGVQYEDLGFRLAGGIA